MQNNNVAAPASGMGAGNGVAALNRLRHERMTFLISCLVGCIVDIEVLSGCAFRGVLHTASLQNTDLGVVLRNAVKIKPVDEGTPGEKLTYYPVLVIEGKNFVSLRAVDVSLDGHIYKSRGTLPEEASPSSPVPERANGEKFATDTQISAKRIGVAGRKLEKFDHFEGAPGSDAARSIPADVGGSLDDDPRGKNGIVWDQFAENERRFGVKTDFKEELYTTKLDRTAQDFKEREAMARKLASEIEGKTSKNIHVMEERGQALGKDYDEEALYGAVIRDGTDKPKKVAAPATSAAQSGEAEKPAAESAVSTLPEAAATKGNNRGKDVNANSQGGAAAKTSSPKSPGAATKRADSTSTATLSGSPPKVAAVPTSAAESVVVTKATGPPAANARPAEPSAPFAATGTSAASSVGPGESASNTAKSQTPSSAMPADSVPDASAPTARMEGLTVTNAAASASKSQVSGQEPAADKPKAVEAPETGKGTAPAPASVATSARAASESTGSGTTKEGTVASKPKTKLNVNAKEFKLNVNATEFKPTFATAPAANLTPVLAPMQMPEGPVYEEAQEYMQQMQAMNGYGMPMMTPQQYASAMRNMPPGAAMMMPNAAFVGRGGMMPMPAGPFPPGAGPQRFPPVSMPGGFLPGYPMRMPPQMMHGQNPAMMNAYYNAQMMGGGGGMYPGAYGDGSGMPMDAGMGMQQSMHQSPMHGPGVPPSQGMGLPGHAPPSYGGPGGRGGYVSRGGPGGGGRGGNQGFQGGRGGGPPAARGGAPFQQHPQGVPNQGYPAGPGAPTDEQRPGTS
ncbi:PAB1-binding protein 1 [Porphyridium purpureum]|uniref:PAB1-binding protein 1 n=1 Tax=Porphyridium purpureum TaxID=35688 RepID=A0A5J4YT85_PORPP|nr:PAB1-binding protein 1 [Porphyridium purpureum]|eukprot:POR1443..scf229_5